VGRPTKDDGLIDERFLSRKDVDALWDPGALIDGETCSWRHVMIGELPMHECTPAQLEAELNVMRALYRAFGKLSDRQMERVRLVKHFIELANEGA
jgi:hypothetical protein